MADRKGINYKSVTMLADKIIKIAPLTEPERIFGRVQRFLEELEDEPYMQLLFKLGDNMEITDVRQSPSRCINRNVLLACFDELRESYFEAGDNET